MGSCEEACPGPCNPAPGRHEGGSRLGNVLCLRAALATRRNVSKRWNKEREGRKKGRTGGEDEERKGKERWDLGNGNSMLMQRKIQRKWSFYLPQGTREYEMLKNKQTKTKVNHEKSN